MKKNWIQWSLIVLLAAFGAACNDGGENITDDPDGGSGELKPVVLPDSLRVEKLTDMSVVLAWNGTSTEYEVQWNGENLPTKSTSYGLEGLTPETTYEWKVRSKEGDRYSEWVGAEKFTTLELIDYTKDWTGDWAGSDFRLSLDVMGFGAPIESFLPEEILQEVIELSIKKKEGTIDHVFLDISRLQEISSQFPAEVEGRINNNFVTALVNDLNDTLRPKDVEFPLSFEDLPEEIKSLVDTIATRAPLVGEMVDSLINELFVEDLGIVISGLSLTGELDAETDKLDMKFSVTGKLHLLFKEKEDGEEGGSGEGGSASLSAAGEGGAGEGEEGSGEDAGSGLDIGGLLNTFLKLMSKPVSIDADVTLSPKVAPGQ